MTQELPQVIASLLNSTQKTDFQANALKVKFEAIKAKYDPVKLARQEFNNWRSSNEGKQWKSRQYKAVDGFCLGCGYYFPIDNFEIDHIQPVTAAPHLAITLKNLQLLCSACNKKKSNL
jgi:5-methylcytosine-specific restriction endonuclease McrA